MPVRKILLYAENAAPLRRKSEPVRKLNKRIRELIQDLKDTLMERPDGAGLAAPQINVHDRVVAVWLGLSDEVDPGAVVPVALINPVILEAGDERATLTDASAFQGCTAPRDVRTI